jgi:hypothetical protein
LTGAIFDAADLSGALMANAIFNGYATPAKKVAGRQGAKLGKAVAGAVAQGMLAEVRGGDSDVDEDEDDGDDGAEVGEMEILLSADNIAHALDRVAAAAVAGLRQLLRVRALLSAEFEKLVQRVGALPQRHVLPSCDCPAAPYRILRSSVSLARCRGRRVGAARALRQGNAWRRQGTAGGRGSRAPEENRRAANRSRGGGGEIPTEDRRRGIKRNGRAAG